MMREQVPGVTCFRGHDTCRHCLKHSQLSAKVLVTACIAVHSALVPRRHVHVTLHRLRPAPCPAASLIPHLLLPDTEGGFCYNSESFFKCYHDVSVFFFLLPFASTRRASGRNETMTFSPVTKLFSSISR
ncbi:MAG: hypothetical protein MZV63_39030 [Marinilabiliales bacterium]|nr:hypothetical protein [Marinilabiliales bacterium]